VRGPRTWGGTTCTTVGLSLLGQKGSRALSRGVVWGGGGGWFNGAVKLGRLEKTGVQAGGGKN